ncbi:methyl-accepting chemotaxis protein [Pseudoduganella danionis]|uniref:methyl-accepting chemotaxis protein n=1 Tax=Pseudoduganella danionis TaxID=1890295 RepID=UPI0035B35776
MNSIDALLDRLLLWQKFVLLAVVALVVALIPATLYLQQTTATIAAAQTEIEGTAPAAAIFKVIQLTQQHRGLAALALGGAPEAGQKRSAKQQQVDQAYASMGELIGGMDNADLAQRWEQQQQRWQTLREALGGGQATVAQSYLLHTSLISGLLGVNDMVADQFGLQLDTSIDSHQLIQAVYYQMPYLAEETGRLRALGTALLNQHEASAEQRAALAGAIARVQDRLEQTGTALRKATAASPALASALAAPWQTAEQQTLAIMALASERIVQADTLDYASATYLERATSTIDAQFAINGAAASSLTAMLDARIEALRMRRWMMFGAMAGLIVAAGLFARLIARSVSQPLVRAVEITRRIAQGDLTSRFEQGGQSETAQLMHALQDMNQGLLNIVSSVRNSVGNIDSASCDISSGNMDLSSRTETQASNLQQTAASMEQITATVRQSVDHAREVDQLISAAAGVAGRGGDVVQQVVGTMGEINQAARRIVDIISVIDGIAFQTNLLALNASVEAARAGEQGRGFAVVAGEVRNLAQRSAAAARDIKQLIDNSVQRIEAGNALAEHAGQAMTEVVGSVQRVTAIMAHMVEAAQEQSTGIEQVNLAIAQIDEMTQQNAALVEQSAAASESLKEQAGALSDAVAVFTLERVRPQRMALDYA